MRGMNTTLRLASLGLVLVSLVACPTQEMPSSKAFGLTATLEGVVTLGPMCAVMTENDPKCADKAYMAPFGLRDGAGQMVLRFASDAQGRFKVSVRPGTYTLIPQTPGGAMLPKASAREVTLQDGVTTNVTVQYDSGIR
jgi:hypothetical protein